MHSRLALGTVQFGLDYGVANQAGKVRFEEARNILKLATEHSIDTLDTAIAYGDSESTLGQAGVSNWKVVTKLSAVPDNCNDIAGWVESQVEGSLGRLGIHQCSTALSNYWVNPVTSYPKHFKISRPEDLRKKLAYQSMRQRN